MNRNNFSSKHYNKCSRSKYIFFSPRPDISWNQTLSYQKPQKIYVGQNLHFPFVEKADEGLYTCYTSNGRIAQDINLVVQRKSQMSGVQTNSAILIEFIIFCNMLQTKKNPSLLKENKLKIDDREYFC